MPKPLPWSASTLAEFKSCPRQYHEKRVLKTIPWEGSEAQRWGEYVHKAFEDNQRDGTKLPPDLVAHQPFMDRLNARSGTKYIELKAAIDTRMQICDFWDKNVWMRSKIDWLTVNDTASAQVVDYKTGKIKDDWEQLALYAIWCFVMWEHVHTVDVMFYWTTNLSTSRKIYKRAELPKLWAMFIPDLKQYREAFLTDTWQPRQSGLCKGWCGVTGCEFWSPKRSK